jgi:hypothetical protein
MIRYAWPPGRASVSPFKQEGDMRFLMRISWDVEAGNAIIRSGKLGPVVQSILADQKPEAAYLGKGGYLGHVGYIDYHDTAAVAAFGGDPGS